jgi:RNA polymerase sigma factor (sigma-70 family)
MTNVVSEESDGQLLQRVHVLHEADAFATLLRRHGPMVLAVCRRVLKDNHLAEDAFQETFLLLHRKAGIIARPQLLSSWLYGVACRIAMQTRSKVDRQRRREAQVDDLPAAAPVGPVAWDDLGPTLDAELERLPEKYRSPIVLCHLQGKTNQEAADHLGWPKGTVQVRLARGRDLLRQRLTRRGMALTAGAFLLLLRAKMVAAAVPPALVLSTIEASTLPLSAPMAAPASPLVQLPLAPVRGSMLFLSRPMVALAMAVTALIVGAGVAGVALLTQQSEPVTVRAEPSDLPPEVRVTPWVEDAGSDFANELLEPPAEGAEPAAQGPKPQPKAGAKPAADMPPGAAAKPARSVLPNAAVTAGNRPVPSVAKGGVFSAGANGQGTRTGKGQGGVQRRPAGPVFRVNLGTGK